MELDPRSLIVASVMSAALMGVVSVTFARLHGEDRIIGAWGSGMLVIAMHGLRTFLGQQSRDVVGWGLTAADRRRFRRAYRDRDERRASIRSPA